MRLFGCVLELRLLRMNLHFERRNMCLMSRVQPSEFLLSLLNNVNRASALILERLSRLVALIHGVSRSVFKITNLRFVFNFRDLF